MDIQPSDGFGTLLPQERLELDLIFSPTLDKDYSFQLTCKSEFNRFTLCFVYCFMYVKRV